MSNIQGEFSGKKVDIEQASDLIDGSNILESFDAGSFFIHKVVHPVMGLMAVVTSSAGDCCYMLLV